MSEPLSDEERERLRTWLREMSPAAADLYIVDAAMRLLEERDALEAACEDLDQRYGQAESWLKDARDENRQLEEKLRIIFRHIT